MSKYHLLAVGVGMVLGVVLAPKLRSLPVLGKLPSV